MPFNKLTFPRLDTGPVEEMGTPNNVIEIDVEPVPNDKTEKF